MIWNFCTLDEDMLRQALFTLLDHDGDKALRMWRGSCRVQNALGLQLPPPTLTLTFAAIDDIRAILESVYGSSKRKQILMDIYEMHVIEHSKRKQEPMVLEKDFPDTLVR